MLDFTFNVTGDNAKTDLILEGVTQMLVELEELQTKVTELEDASAAAVGLLELIKEKLDEAIANASNFEELRAGVTEVSTRIGQEKQDLADAVAANTPAE